jgi:plasmid stabilization system protein ParE
MTYTLRILPAAEEENAATVEWLVAHVSPDRAATYVAAISKALHEIVELPFAWPRWRGLPDVRVRHLRASPTRSSTEFGIGSYWSLRSPT